VTRVTVTQSRARVRVTGTVQGVGFRPYVYRLAGELGLDGWVLNDELGVLVEVQGRGPAVERFIERLPVEAPPLAAVEAVAAEELPLGSGDRGFRILASASAGDSEALVSPDMATCEDCLRELFDPADRRYRYPFINCTNCGPRFTIVRDVPYDRPLTTMARFEMCERCRAEYDDPTDRRFHAQPNACPDCGPALCLLDAEGKPLGIDDPLGAAVEALAGGLIVAVKGLGGWHLACDAARARAVTELRTRKHREEKPFALMARDLPAARSLVELSPADEQLLSARERPIVIARRRPGTRVAAAAAPGRPDLGVMLPYSPLHHLLLADVGTTLVMTSGNVSDEPIAYQDDDAARRLRGIADRFLAHDRPIHIRTDDSVVRSTAAGPVLLRRSRGYVPSSLALPLECRTPLLACGAELKNTFCVAKGRRAWVGHHVGDLQNWETLRSFREGVEHFERLFAVRPELVVHDLHPDYLSTRYALERNGMELLGVQHHHAHLAACLAEHGERGPAVGAIFDGTGYGSDGTIWGGELLLGDLGGYERLGALHPVAMPGGDRAVREPWRMACAWLAAALDCEEPPLPSALASRVAPARWHRVAELARRGLASPVTSSAGRLFDAVAAICGVRARVSFEGQAAAELEAVARPDEPGRYELPLIDARPDQLELDARETVRGVWADALAGTPVPVIAGRFHNGLADGTAAACARLAERAGVETVVVSGGVFQNRLLLERTVARLSAGGLRVLFPERLSPNDGGISYGQAAIGAAVMEA
jgi:hydrogenase maturation protein HypF